MQKPIPLCGVSSWAGFRRHRGAFATIPFIVEFVSSVFEWQNNVWKWNRIYIMESEFFLDQWYHKLLKKILANCEILKRFKTDLGFPKDFSITSFHKKFIKNAANWTCIPFLYLTQCLELLFHRFVCKFCIFFFVNKQANMYYKSSSIILIQI